jgi:hypothetical protein
MFHTYPDAELSMPIGLAPNGERSWHWMELGIKIAYLFVTAQIETDEGDAFTRHLWFSQIEPVMQIAQQAGKGFHLVRLDVFSPGHMNGGDGYRLDQVKQVWRSRGNPTTLRFLLVDGGILWQRFDDEHTDDDDTELILAI